MGTRTLASIRVPGITGGFTLKAARGFERVSRGVQKNEKEW